VRKFEDVPGRVRPGKHRKLVHRRRQEVLVLLSCGVGDLIGDQARPFAVPEPAHI
jgi:hypothetical protein